MKLRDKRAPRGYKTTGFARGFGGGEFVYLPFYENGKVAGSIKIKNPVLRVIEKKT